MRTTTPIEQRSLRIPALTAGLALVAMALLGLFGNFVAVQGPVTPGDVESTAADIAASATLFRLGVVALLAVAVLDIVVALALASIFESVNRTVAVGAAWLRVAYAAVFVSAIGQLALAVDRLDDPASALEAVEVFESVWSLALGVFGCHLVALGYLAWKAPFIHSAFGLALAVAGLGYLVDSLGRVLVGDYGFSAATVTFVGEIALLVWLLTRGVRVRLAPAA